MKDSFIPEKRRRGGEERWHGGGEERRKLSHGGHRHDISGLNGLAFSACPPPPPPLPPLASSASLDAALGLAWASRGHHHCLRAGQRAFTETEGDLGTSHGPGQQC